MHILLLGATGYLGRNIYESLKKEHEVYCITRKGVTKDIDEENKFNNYTQLETVVNDIGFDWVINCVGAYDKGNDYKKIIDANYYFPFSIFNYTIEKKIRNYINIGTSLPNNVGIYSLTKNQLADIMRVIASREEINFANLRLEMFYGGDFVGHKTFFDNLVAAMRENRTIDVTEGRQRRDIIRVEDVVSLIEHIIKSDYISGYMDLDVGSGENAEMREIENYLKELCKSKSLIRYGAIPIRENEPNTLADVSWYDKVGFHLQYAYWEGLEDFYGSK